MRHDFNWLADLGPEAVAAFESRGKIRTYRNGTLIYACGDVPTTVMQIVRGAIRQFALSPDGQQVLIYVYRPNDIVADASVIDDEPYPLWIDARGETVVRQWSLQDIAELRSIYPEIDRAIAKQMYRRLRSVLLMVQELGMFSTAGRVAARMCWLAEMTSCEDEMYLTLSQTDIAAMTNATRQSVNHAIMEMKQLGIVDAQYGKVIVRDLPALRRFREERRRNR